MHFSRSGVYYRASRITGPHHNLLEVELSVTPATDPPTVQVLPAIGESRHKTLDPREILRFVIEGVRDANARFGTRYSVRSIRVVEDDTPPEAAYGYLASCIVEQLASGALEEIPTTTNPC